MQVRAHGEAVPCTVRLTDDDGVGDRLVVELERPLRGVAPGQAAVLYDGDRVVGAATIAATDRTVQPA
ncbi:hypothetical protein GCM10025868_39540 [Angustibacter aerolatus]|uniref:tRNA-specific 2-thiouridylase MnmA-like C-terminal domain-containing protein n=1 Tax=Angustibacter aerolatus TaxID=1162965 RepID=A0ABQ6JMZ5_9ACTN|nr:hypothetical protein GCM10025868_39540 [Angustibacter aerolatus]